MAAMQNLQPGIWHERDGALRDLGSAVDVAVTPDQLDGTARLRSSSSVKTFSGRARPERRARLRCVRMACFQPGIRIPARTTSKNESGRRSRAWRPMTFADARRVAATLGGAGSRATSCRNPGSSSPGSRDRRAFRPERRRAPRGRRPRSRARVPPGPGRGSTSPRATCPRTPRAPARARRAASSTAPPRGDAADARSSHAGR